VAKVLKVLQTAEYWIIPVALLGAIIGSFLNVVIFRLPLGLSISRPRWSFCPHCQTRIRPHHNLPIIGWLGLRGRCHHCRGVIAMVYPVVECMTALLFVMVWDVLFVARALPGVGAPASDWPLAIAYFVLFAGLLATSVMDVESYTIDIRLCTVIMLAGVLCHAALGMPAELSRDALPSGGTASRAASFAGELPDSIAVVGAAMGIAWFLTLLIAGGLAKRRATQGEPGDPGDGSEEQSSRSADSGETTAYLNTADQRFRPLPILTLAALVVGLVVWQRYAPDQEFGLPMTAGSLRGLVGGSVLFFLLLLASIVQRDADEQIVEDIQAESEHARAMVTREFAWFIPAILIGAGLFCYFRLAGTMDAGFADLMGGASLGGPWLTHLHGTCQAAAAMVMAAALGWTVRISGTLAFGKEAFGTGDIYIMAAMGAVAGFWAVVFAFFLAALLALVGALVVVFCKSSRAIPFGPWLALGAFVELWLRGGLLAWFRPAGKLLWSILIGRPEWLSGT